MFAQKLTVNAYDVRITTKEDDHLRGISTDVDSLYLYVGYGISITLPTIRKVRLRRKNQTPALLTGILVGGLLTRYLAHQSLQTSQVRSAVTYGLTLTFAAVGGVTAELIVGSGVHSLALTGIGSVS